MRFKFFIILFTITIYLFSQNNFSTEIDSLLEESHQKFFELKFIESSNIADEALNLSVMNNYSKGKVMSSIYIAKVLIEIGLNMEALRYFQDLYEEPYFKNDVIAHVETHRLKGRVYGSQQLYTLAKEEFNKQLLLSEKISDPNKKELSKLWAYQNIEHLYFLQKENDSIEAYQKLQEKQLLKFEEHEIFHNISALFSTKGKLYLIKGEYEASALQLHKSLEILDKYNVPYRYNTLQLLGDLEASKGNKEQAIFYYDEALKNSNSLNATLTSRNIHKVLVEYLIKNDTLLDKAKVHGKEYIVLNDSLEKHNRMVVNTILKTILEDKDNFSARRVKNFRYILFVFISLSLLVGFLLIIRNKKSKKELIEKDQVLNSKALKIEELKEEIESNIFQEIIELAKSNSPEFLSLFAKGYPDFVEAMRELDPKIRSTELYFCALAYLNFSTKDIANYTFVTTRAVQMRKNRMRKKHNIPSEVDFNEWFRSLVPNVPVDEER